MLDSVYDSNDAVGLSELIAGRELDALEVLEFAIRRIEERNPRINSVIATRFEQALEEVRKGLPDGVQFAACHGGETTLLRLAADIERASPWP
jgi:Asp-tRNA(Asn)/Glu-tRNA(Gln) amidotransferase A subunit family amidase